MFPCPKEPSSVKWSVDFLKPWRVMVLPQAPYIFDDPTSGSIISELAIPPLRRRRLHRCRFGGGGGGGGGGGFSIISKVTIFPSLSPSMRVSHPSAFPPPRAPSYESLDVIRAADVLTSVGLAHLLKRERSGSWTDTLSRGESNRQSR